MTPEESGEELVRAVERRTRELVTPLQLRMILALDRWAPSIVDRLLRWKILKNPAATASEPARGNA